MKKRPDVDSIISLLFATGRLIREHASRGSGKSRVSFIQCEVLKYIESCPRLTMKELASYLCITAPSATSLIEELEKQKLVKRLHNASDRRVVTLDLTAKGRTSVDLFNRGKHTGLEEVLGKLSSEDRTKFVAILRHIQDIYSNI